MITRLLEILVFLSIFIVILVLIRQHRTVKTFIPEFLAGLSIGIAILVLIHQHLTTNDVWFNWHEFQHHESVIACFVVAAIALLVGKYLGRG